jgi:hypothetical protein
MILPLLHLKKLSTYIFGNHELRIEQWTMDRIWMRMDFDFRKS